MWHQAETALFGWGSQITDDLASFTGVHLVSRIAGQVSNDQAVTWVGLLSGGLPVAAVLIVGWMLLLRRYDAVVKERNELQEARLKEKDEFLREALPVIRECTNALLRATVLWDRQVNQTGGGT